MEERFRPYEGKEPYIFVSYAHKDREQVYPLLEALADASYRLWYDQGIPWSERWADVIVDRVENCAVCLAFLSRASDASRDCQDEIYYAISEKKPIFPVYLDDVRPSGGLKMRLRPYQSVHLSQFDGPSAFVGRLGREGAFVPCRASLWNKIGQIQWYLRDEDGVLTIAKYEDLPADRAAAPIPAYRPDLVHGGSTAPWMLFRDKIRSVRIHDGIDLIGDHAFRDCEALTDIAIPASVTAVGRSAFEDCQALTDVVLPGGIGAVGPRAFASCIRLSNVSLPDSVTSIGDEAFAGCVSLTSVTIPDSVTSIGMGAFVNCDGLTSVTIPDSVTSIGMGAFLGDAKLSIVTIPDWTKLDRQAFGPRTHVIRNGGDADGA